MTCAVFFWASGLTIAIIVPRNGIFTGKRLDLENEPENESK
jgi:hypothetical protein